MQDISPFPFDGRTALITGAGSGIGEALAIQLADRGMRLVLADLNFDNLQGVKAQILASHPGADVRCEALDVTDDVAVEALAGRLDAASRPVDLLCNNAGIITRKERFRAVWEYGLDDWQQMLDVNLMGVVHGIRSFVPRMIARGQRAHVLNTSSIAGLISGSGVAPYSVAKHGVVRVSEALYASAVERGIDLGVTVLCPGTVRTHIFDGATDAPDLSDPTIPDAAAVARIAIEAIASNRLYAVTTDAFDPMIRARSEALLARENPSFTDARRVEVKM